jgi:hypothetical protein
VILTPETNILLEVPPRGVVPNEPGFTRPAYELGLFEMKRAKKVKE